MRTKKATKKSRINIIIDSDKKNILDEILKENNDSKTDIILECIDNYIKKNQQNK